MIEAHLRIQLTSDSTPQLSSLLSLERGSPTVTHHDINPFAFFIEREGALHDAAIHLQQAAKHISRIGWYRHHDLLEDQDCLLTVY